MDPTQPTASLGVGNLSPDTFSQYTWAVYVLTLIGAPITANNVNNFVTWMAAENSPSTWTGTAGANNPLNNGLGSGGGAGLGSYPDLATAGEYAAKGIMGGIGNSAQIGAALKADAPFSVFQAATINSDWASSHYAGSGYASLTAPMTPGAVSVNQSAKNGATKPTLGTRPGGGIWNIIGNVITGPLAAGANVIGGAADAAHNAVSWTEELAHLLGHVNSADWWKRVGLFSAGVVLVISGVILFVSTTKTGERAETAAVEGAIAA